jgi:capsular polysaccharide biosynthesis protein
MTAHRTPSVGLRAVARWWPVVLLPAVIAVAAAVWSVNHQMPTYAASTRLVVIPLAQWDETFLGTSLIRDAGDPKTTATTVAALLDTPRVAASAAAAVGGDATPESVGAAVDVVVVPDSNVVEVRAVSPDPGQAERVSRAFATAAVADRWRTISAELDGRIGALAATTASDPNTGEASARLQTLTVIRQTGLDPTLRMDDTGTATADERLPVAMVVGFAALGGLLVGVLCAFGMARLRRPTETPFELAPTAPAAADPVPAYSPNGGG